MAACSDDVIWTVIDNQFCSYKLKLPEPQKDKFCRNEYNVSGVCSRLTCPLANSRYATVRNIDGQIYLYIKTAERQHLPNRWWERVKLSADPEVALAQLEEHLAYWPEYTVKSCKQRLIRLREVLMTERRLALRQDERQFTTKSSKVKRREATRERKALVAAKLERAIERELLDRLKSGAYGDQPLNVDEAVWKKVMKGMKQAEGEQEAESESEKEQEAEGEVEYVEDDDEDDEDVVDVEDIERWLDQSGSGSDSDGNGSASDGSDDDSDDGSSRRPKPRKHVRAGKPAGKSVPRRPNMEYELEDERRQVAQT